MSAEVIYVRFKLGVLDLSDVTQQVRIDSNCYFYFQPSEDLRVGMKNSQTRFENIDRPHWLPHFDFANECDEALLTDESYWIDMETGKVFGRANFIPSLQQRFNHRAFPFDRQIIKVEALFNNCLVKPWELFDSDLFPPELSLSNPSWLAEGELNATADSWDLIDIDAIVNNDEFNKSSKVTLLIYIEREVAFYFWNIVMVYFIIIFLKVVLIAFPYTSSRFDFAMVLALTTVAFKFVVSEMVPKTSYTTWLDKYMLVGLLLLASRFLVDFGFQFGYETSLPFGPDGIRVSCSNPLNVNIANDVDGFDVCQMDKLFTGVLASAWLLLLLIFTVAVFIKPIQQRIRPKWDTILARMFSVNEMVESDPSLATQSNKVVDMQYGLEIKGTSVLQMRWGNIRHADLKDAVEYKSVRRVADDATITQLPGKLMNVFSNSFSKLH